MAIEFSRFQNRHQLEDFEPIEPPEPPEPPPPPPPAVDEAPSAAAEHPPTNLLLTLPAAPLAPDYVAVGEPPQASVLNELPETRFQAVTQVQAQATVAANDPAPPAAAAAYVGEPPVTADWLAARETALTAVRSDYEAQRAQAQATAGSGPGWVDAVMFTDESGHRVSASGAPTVFIADAGAAPQIIGYDEGGPIYGGVAGRHVEFSEDAFAAHYRAQGGAPLQTLAGLYDTDAATLLAHHPEIWGIATSEHALNAGPAPAGRAMGDAGQLAMLDLYMADPQVAELIQRYGGSVAPATSGIALEQVRLHGQARYEQMTRLANAMQAVRNDYSGAMQQAMANGGPGWVEQPRMVTITDESGVVRTEPMVSRDESGVATAITERFFDPDRFTAWYVQQSAAANQAFASFYGQSHTQWGTDESGVRVVSSIGFDNPSWQMGGAGGPMSHNELVSLDPNHAPRLNDNSAVGFDFEAGWATHHSNIHQKRDWFETVVQVAFVAAAAWVTGGAAAGWAGAAGYGAGASAAIAGAAAGATASAVSGAMNGNLSFKSILQGALSGAITGGVLRGEIGAAVNGVAGPAGTIVFRGTLQGGINALLGGDFKDGAIAGVASGLADLAGANINKSIAEAVDAGALNPAEALAARSMARIFASAVRTLGSPGDPQYAFASDLVGSVVNGGLDATRPAPAPTFAGTAFDDEGFLMPGVVDPDATPAQQQQQLLERLVGQGVPLAEATRQVWRWATQDTGNAANPLSTNTPDGEPRPQGPADWYTGRAFDGSPARPATPHEVALLENAMSRIQQTDFPQVLDLQNNPNQRLLHISFDGTWNDRDQQPLDTNPAELQRLINASVGDSGTSLYFTGIGSSGGVLSSVIDGSVNAGNAGAGIVGRAYQELQQQVLDWHKENPGVQVVVSLAGFSRGGAQALDLANRLQAEGIPDPGRPGQYLIAPGAITLGPIVLYDPVDMTNGTLNVAVPSNASSVLVLGAGNEFRAAFPAVSVVDPAQPDDRRITRIELPGAHTDIGRGYDQGIGNYTLQMGRDYFARSGVPIGQPGPELQPGAGPVMIHDSMTDGFGNTIWSPRPGGREIIVTPNPRPQPTP